MKHTAHLRSCCGQTLGCQRSVPPAVPHAARLSCEVSSQCRGSFCHETAPWVVGKRPVHLPSLPLAPARAAMHEGLVCSLQHAAWVRCVHALSQRHQEDEDRWITTASGQSRPPSGHGPSTRLSLSFLRG